MKVRTHKKCGTEINNENDNNGQYHCSKCGVVNASATELKEKESEFKEQLKKTVHEMNKLAEVWNEEEVKQYPKYLPSFDEFVNEFRELIEEAD